MEFWRRHMPKGMYLRSACDWHLDPQNKDTVEKFLEWAALLVEAGASAVHLSHRHDSPTFEEADWSWVNALVDHMVENPAWFRNLSQEEKDAIGHRMWAEGRMKLEPWLGPRVQNDRVHVRPRTEVLSCHELDNGELEVELSNGETVVVDQIILATGYKVNIAQLPVLASGNILAKPKTRNGFPELDDHFETSIPGLFITSMPATQDFAQDARNLRNRI